MASKRRLRRKMCGQKRRYDSHKAALTALIRLIRVKPRGGMMRCYRCRFCHGYHFGHFGSPDRTNVGRTSRLAT